MEPFPHPKPGQHRWEQPAARDDLELDAPPASPHKRRRSMRSMQATVHFTEMLCQIDRRLDRILPACWCYHGYLFMVLDALRCSYYAAYGSARDSHGVLHPATHSEHQYRFWQDEDAAIHLMSAYQQAQGECDHDTGNPAGYSAATTDRRRVEAIMGMPATECYPFAPNDIADHNPLERQKTIKPDDGPDLGDHAMVMESAPLSSFLELDDSCMPTTLPDRNPSEDPSTDARTK